MNKEINVQDLGLKDYKETWDLQERLFKKIIDTKVRNRSQSVKLPTSNHFICSAFNFW